jgi:hypothetical protein
MEPRPRVVTSPSDVSRAACGDDGNDAGLAPLQHVRQVPLREIRRRLDPRRAVAATHDHLQVVQPCSGAWRGPPQIQELWSYPFSAYGCSSKIDRMTAPLLSR